MMNSMLRFTSNVVLFFCFLMVNTAIILAQGVTTSELTGIVKSDKGEVLPGANVVVVFEPTGAKYGANTRSNGQYNITNMRIGGPYAITVSFVGYKTQKQQNVYLNLGQESRLDFTLVEEAIKGEEVLVTADLNEVINSDREGAATNVSPQMVQDLPTLKRSVRDLTRLDPRSDGNYSFGGKNWLYNNISLDGSYFNNPFGLDDPAPGGQANAEPFSYDAVDQVQISIAPFDVREGGFTGAGINTVTKSGTNEVKGSIYSYIRNESFLGNDVRGQKVVANPDLSYNQSGVSVSGPIIPNELFFFLNAEVDRREDPGTNFVANRGTSGFGISRVDAATMDAIRSRLKTVYGYETGPYDNFIHETQSEKLLLKLDWLVSDDHKVMFRYNRLDGRRDLPPHPFVLSAFGTGRGPNENTLPFRNSGYRINNRLNSYALEVNSRFDNFSNRFFASYNRFRDSRDAFSAPFPTLEIVKDGIAYTTVGHEPFSVHNILDQDVLQFTNNLSYYLDNHVITVGATFEKFSFFNSFNIFKYGFDIFGPLTIDQFFRITNRADTLFRDFNKEVANALKSDWKGEKIDVAQLAIYAQDEYLISSDFNLTYGVRVDFPIYLTDIVANPYSTGLTLLDENGNPETLDQSKLPKTTPLFSPRIGFNWDVEGKKETQLRGGTGIFTGRVPFVWIGNVISNPGANPNVWGPFNTGVPKVKTSDDAILQQSYDLNAADPDFKWPQVWTTNLGLDKKLPYEMYGTLELLYGKDLNAVYVRNADLVKPVRYLPDGRPYYGGAGKNELNPADFGAGVYTIDNTSEGYNYSITAQLRKAFENGLFTSVSYTYLEAKSNMKSTEIASVLWQGNPVRGNPNKPELSYSEFGVRNRITGVASYKYHWSENNNTTIGAFFEIAEGNRFAGQGGNRYSFTYAGDVNGDGQGGNDLIYIPRNQSEINFDPFTGTGGSVAEQWAAFNAFIEQDDYLKANRGKIAERFGALNPWYSNIDLKVLHEISFMAGTQKHSFQISADILNVANLLNSEWGVRSVASAAATSPLELKRFDANGAPVFNFKGIATQTFVDDLGLSSRWQMQIGVRYLFN